MIKFEREDLNVLVISPIYQRNFDGSYSDV